MRDLWDAEFKDVDRINGIGLLIAVACTFVAVYAGLGWWSAAVFVGILLFAHLLRSRIERKYDRLRLETDMRGDEEDLGLGWDSKAEAQAHLASLPLYWRETHCAMRYFNKHGQERWGVVNLPKYWRDAEAQERVKKQYAPTAEEEAMMENMRLQLIKRARGQL